MLLILGSLLPYNIFFQLPQFLLYFSEFVSENQVHTIIGLPVLIMLAFHYSSPSKRHRLNRCPLIFLAVIKKVHYFVILKCSKCLFSSSRNIRFRSPSFGLQAGRRSMKN